jgi:hypothetical protein
METMKRMEEETDEGEKGRSLFDFSFFFDISRNH